MGQTPKKPVKPIKRQLLLFVIENGVKCAYCHRKYDDIKVKRTVDHIIPKSKGGETTPNNVLICCGTCNVDKGNENVEDYIKNNKRAKENIRRYMAKIELCMINNKSYAKKIEWLSKLIN